jgi:glutaconate CoA-transferase subunit B
MSGDYSAQEMMIVAAAREIRDREVVFVGMRLPLTAYAVARLTHAPNAVGLFECGLQRDAPAAETLYTMGDPANQEGAMWATGTCQVMGMLPRGRVDIGFIGGAEVDRYGNVNTSYIGDVSAPRVKLPGSGGAADIAAMAGRLLVVMRHEKRRLVARVDYVTTPGYLDGGDSRAAAGLGRGGPAALITDLAILRPRPPENALCLASWHPGSEVAEITANTGWALEVLPQAGETPAPTAAELAALRRVDSEGFWRR